MSLTEHLEELRYRIVASVLGFGAGCAVAWHLTPGVLASLEQVAGRLIFTTPGEAFASYLKIVVVLGLALASPLVVGQAWLFVVPALYPPEHRMLVRLGPVAALLFAAGLAFGYFVIQPVALRFLIGVAGPGVTPAISVARFLSFLSGVTLPFGVVFEMPLGAWVLGRLGLMAPGTLRGFRRYAVFLAFVVGAVLTPPDVFSQLLMAGPLVILYEISIWTASAGARRRGGDAAP